MLDDGVYGLVFAHGEAAGGGSGNLRSDGLAVLRDGRILGSDRHGGIFKGCFSYDVTRREAIVEVRLAVPPYGALLTGHEAGPEGALLDLSVRFSPSPPVSTTMVEIGGEMITVELRYLGSLA